MTRKGEGIVKDYLNSLGSPDPEDAFHSLAEALPEALPVVFDAFRSETDPDRRAALVEAVSQCRDARTLPIVAAALRDTSDAVWKEALDGLVAVDGDEAVGILLAERGCRTAKDEKAEWIDEALEEMGVELP